LQIGIDATAFMIMCSESKLTFFEGSVCLISDFKLEGPMGNSTMRYRLAAFLSIFVALTTPILAQSIIETGVESRPVAEQAQASGGLVIQRAGATSRVLSPEGLAALKPFTQRAALGGGAGDSGNEWTGPLLWDVLNAVGAVDGARPRDQAHLAVRVTGADGYTAVVALGEISPQFANQPIQLADRMNGKPLPGQGLRLIVPEDVLGGRSVRDVVRIEIY
jgi:Oxidoreductase molybdopterin binding domain